MSIHIKFDGEHNQNISRPWNLDIGNIIHIDNDGNKKSIKAVFEKDNNGRFHHIWKNHDLFRFGLLDIIDVDNKWLYRTDNYLATYPTLRDHPFGYLINQLPNIFYPTNDKEDADNTYWGNLADIEYYKVYVNPNGGQIQLNLRSCNYRYTKKYGIRTYFEGIKNPFDDTKTLPKYPNDVVDYVDGESRWITAVTIEQNSNATSNLLNDDSDSKDNITDYIAVINIDKNTSLTNDRSAKIVLAQYDENNKFYTGKVIILKIVQLRDRVIFGTQNYKLTWFKNEDCTDEIKDLRNELEKNKVSSDGGSITAYFTITGTGQTWAGETDKDLWYGKWDYLCENIEEDLCAELREDYANISKLELLNRDKIESEKSVFAVTVKFDSNEPDPNKPGGVSLIPIEPDNFGDIGGIEIPADNTESSVKFKIQNKIKTEDRFANIVIKLKYKYYNDERFKNNAEHNTYYGDGFWKTFAPDNDLAVWQSGKEIIENITNKFVEKIQYDGFIVGTIEDDSYNIDKVEFSYYNDYVEATLKLKHNNISDPDYALKDVKLDGDDKVSYDTTEKTIFFKVIKTIPPTFEKYYKINIEGISNCFEGYNPVSVNTNYTFKHIESNGDETYLNWNNGIKGNWECKTENENEIKTIDKGNFDETDKTQNGDELSIKVKFTSNNAISTGIYNFQYLEPCKYYIINGRYFEFKESTGKRLPANGSNDYYSNEYFIACRLFMGYVSSPRTIKVKLNIEKCEDNIVDNVSYDDLSFTQLAEPLNDYEGNYVWGLNDGFRINDQRVPSEKVVKIELKSGDMPVYMVPIIYDENNLKSNNTTNVSGEYSIEICNKHINEYDYDNGCLPIYFNIYEEKQVGGEERNIDIKLTHDDAGDNEIKTTWRQAANTFTETEEITNIESNKIYITYNTPTPIIISKTEIGNTNDCHILWIYGENTSVINIPDTTLSIGITDNITEPSEWTSSNNPLEKTYNYNEHIIYLWGKLESKNGDFDFSGANGNYNLNVKLKYDIGNKPESDEITCVFPYVGGKDNIENNLRINWTIPENNGVTFSNPNTFNTNSNNKRSEYVKTTLYKNTTSVSKIFNVSASFGNETKKFEIIQTINNGQPTIRVENTDPNSDPDNWIVLDNIKRTSSRTYNVFSQYGNSGNNITWGVRAENTKLWSDNVSIKISTDSNTLKITVPQMPTGHIENKFPDNGYKTTITLYQIGVDNAQEYKINVIIPKWEPSITYTPVDNN